MGNKKLFATVGTTKFDKLCKVLQSPKTIEVLKSLGFNEMTLQIGNDTENYESGVRNGMEIVIYRFKDSIKEDIYNADLIISHAGAGSCLEVLDSRKPLLVVINTDLMDNHQTEIAEQLQNDGHLYYCTCDMLNETLTNSNFENLKPYGKADSKPLFNHLDEYLGLAK